MKTGLSHSAICSQAFLGLLQGGFAIVSAIFLLVVLAALGAFMLTFSTVQHATSAQDIQGSRAYWAARAGLQRDFIRSWIRSMPP